MTLKNHDMVVACFRGRAVAQNASFFANFPQ